MADFLAELRRRHIFRIGGVYVVAAWGVAQVVDLLSQTYALPDWIAQPLLAVLAVGFLFTLLAAWMIVGAAKATDTPAELKKATATDWALIATFVAVLAFIGYQQFALRPAEVVDTRATGAVDEDVEGISERLPNSVAVLPFENLSPNPDDAYFAAGVHESILNELVKISDLTVIARTSVLRYADSNLLISEIADELNVETVMEGSVRYAGEQVRVTAQLIDPDTGAHIWSEEFDRNRTEILAIQSEIAEQIAIALEAELLPIEIESIESAITDSPDAYEAFLKAMAIARDGFDVSASYRMRSILQLYLDEAIALDPDFALAYAWKALVYLSSKGEDPVSEEDWPDFKSEMDSLVATNAEMALALDPSLGLAHAVLGDLYFTNWLAEPAQREAQLALGLSPNDTNVLGFFADVQDYILDQPEEAVRTAQRRVALDPNSEGSYSSLGNYLNHSGRFEEAIEAFQRCLEINPRYLLCNMRLSQAEFNLTNRESSLDALRQSEQLLLVDAPPTIRANIAHPFGLLGQRDAAQRIFETLEDMAVQRYVDPVTWARAYMGLGDYDEALRQLTLAANDPGSIQDTIIGHLIRRNEWSDPTLEQGRFREVLDRLRAQ